MNPTAPPTLADDLESFIHVLAWVALRYMPHKLTAAALTKLMQDYFDDHYKDDDGIVKGGTTKKHQIILCAIPVDCGFRNPNIEDLLEKLMDTFAVRYEKTKKKKKEEEEEEEEEKEKERVRMSEQRRKRARLADSNWMLKTLRRAVRNRLVWPSDDKSCLNPLAK